MAMDWDRGALTAALHRVAGGDRAALKEVYDRTSAKLFGVCLRILKSEIEAEDVLQEVYITVWRKAGTFEEAKASPVTWLATLARNRAIDRLRAGAGRANDSDVSTLAIADPAPSALSGLETGEDMARLHGCIGELEDNHADVLRRAFFEGLTYNALARQIGAPLGTVKGWIRRSLMQLRTCLEA